MWYHVTCKFNLHHKRNPASRRRTVYPVKIAKLLPRLYYNALQGDPFTVNRRRILSETLYRLVFICDRHSMYLQIIKYYTESKGGRDSVGCIPPVNRVYVCNTVSYDMYFTIWFSNYVSSFSFHSRKKHFFFTLNLTKTYSKMSTC